MLQKLNRASSEAELIHKGQSPEDMQTQPGPATMVVARSSIGHGLQGPLDDQATCFFIANWVLQPRQEAKTRGFMEYLLPLLKQRSPPEHFKAAFDACAYASMGNRAGPGQNFKNVALSSYTRALATTHKALQDPILSKQDNTLAAILLLGLYENISARQMGMLAWGSHTEGAIQLVKARGKKQVKTQTGLGLFIAVRTQMVSQISDSSRTLSISCANLGSRSSIP
jgi:hypothetical protein